MNRSIELWEKSFPGLGAEIFKGITPLQEWEPALMPERANLGERIEKLFAGVEDYRGYRSYSRRELAERLMQEAKENEELRARTAKMFLGRPKLEIQSSTIDFVAQNLIRQAPVGLCHPLSVKPVELWLADQNRHGLEIDVLNTLKALLCYTFWWKYSTRIPSCVRGLTLFALNSRSLACIANDQAGISRMDQLIALLIDGNWPIARDANRELIVLVEK